MFLCESNFPDTKTEFYHIPVLKNEVLSFLITDSAGIYFDGTVGGAGHSEAIIKKLTSVGLVIGCDKDPDSLSYIQDRKSHLLPRLHLNKGSFKDMPEILKKENISAINGILLDLGISSYQIDRGERGFSYRISAPLDMRMSKYGLTAAEVVNTYSIEELTKVIKYYGEEKYAHKFAKSIIEEREKGEINSTFRLFEIIKKYIGKGHLVKSASRIFQSLRIEVNKELSDLLDFLKVFPGLLKKNGRVCIISYHSLEDKLVKKCFNDLCKEEFSPREDPTGLLGAKPEFRMVKRGAIKPSEEEISNNSRARSARMRVIEKI